MKKNLLSIVFMLTSSLCTFAQKEYNMVITLNNGTTITLGHNDIKNIKFNDGKISISGDVITTIEALQNKTAEAEQNVAVVASKMDEMMCRIQETQAYVDKVLTEVNMVEAEIRRLQDMLESTRVESQCADDALNASVSENRTIIADLEYRLKTIEEEVNNLRNSSAKKAK